MQRFCNHCEAHYDLRENQASVECNDLVCKFFDNNKTFILSSWGNGSTARLNAQKEISGTEPLLQLELLDLILLHTVLYSPQWFLNYVHRNSGTYDICLKFIWCCVINMIRLNCITGRKLLSCVKPTFFLNWFITHTVDTNCTKVSYKIVPATNFTV
jgi:hypothetical protein